MFAEVLFNLPVNHGFDYAVPAGMTVQAGMRVQAPFSKRKLIGIVREVRPNTSVRYTKPLHRAIDAAPVLSPRGFELATWMADYYACSIGEACASFVPAGLRLRGDATPASPRADGTPSPFQLTVEQQSAFGRMRDALAASRHHVFLLHGVTGSGKTELYLRLIADALARGRSAIVLVPEIALTPQAIDRFRERFGADVAIWHSRLTDTQRSVQWQRVASGESRIVVGTRSAVFAPVADPGVIILDEEHDGSYKQDQTPRYHAREVAIARAKMAKAVVVLGSATPSIESYYAAREGRYTLLELTERVEGRPLPNVEIVDMREELVNRHRLAPLSQRLQFALQRVVETKEQAILLLNRRGFARVAQCPVCGAAMRCPDCTVPLIYHAGSKQMLCHYCNRREDVPELCPACRRGYVRMRGTGTERIESELHRLFPASGIGRMDTDSMKPKDSHRKIYDAITTQEIDLVVGTQMVAKGLDVPQVTLVGVVSADTSLNLPDFRAGELTFDLLTQVAGRAGRGARPGQVLIQTYSPTHYAIQAASKHDYADFYRQEIAIREKLKLPPFVHLVQLVVQGSKRPHVEDTAQALADALIARAESAKLGVRILGPAPDRIMQLRGTFRWRLVLKAKTVEPMVKLVKETLGDGRRFRGLPVIVDVDPL